MADCGNAVARHSGVVYFVGRYSCREHQDYCFYDSVFGVGGVGIVALYEQSLDHPTLFKNFIQWDGNIQHRIVECLIRTEYLILIRGAENVHIAKWEQYNPARLHAMVEIFAGLRNQFAERLGRRDDFDGTKWWGGYRNHIIV